jgi:hypothetical protein
LARSGGALSGRLPEARGRRLLRRMDRRCWPSWMRSGCLSSAKRRSRP